MLDTAADIRNKFEEIYNQRMADAGEFNPDDPVGDQGALADEVHGGEDVTQDILD